MTTYEALTTKPVTMTSLRFPRLHAVIYQEVVVLVRLEDDLPEVPAMVTAVAFLDNLTYVGLIPSANVALGLPAGAPA